MFGPCLTVLYYVLIERGSSMLGIRPWNVMITIKQLSIMYMFHNSTKNFFWIVCKDCKLFTFLITQQKFTLFWIQDGIDIQTDQPNGFKNTVMNELVNTT